MKELEGLKREVVCWEMCCIVVCAVREVGSLW